MWTLAQFNYDLLIAAMLIGVATGWWLRRGSGGDAADDKGKLG